MDLSHAVGEIQRALQGLFTRQIQLPPPPPPHDPPPPPPLPSYTPTLAISYPYGMPTTGAPSSSSTAPLPTTQVPIHQVRFLPSPSPILAWAFRTSEPIYTTASPRAHIPPAPSTGAVMAHGGPFAAGTLYGVVQGPFFHRAVQFSNEGALDASVQGAGQGNNPPNSTSWSSQHMMAPRIP